MIKGDQTLLFYYDESGSPTAFSRNGTMYFYIKNLQGDICKIVTAGGTVVTTYTYDAWGKVLEIRDANGSLVTSPGAIGIVNPLRYRGYVYDDEIYMIVIENTELF